MPFDPQVVDTRPSSERDLVIGLPQQIAGYDPINWNVCRPQLTGNFASVLEKASDEKPLQKFFEEYPEALLTGLVKPHIGWVIPRPRLPKPDGGCVPDFIICEWSSVGPDWIIVELESPTTSPFTKSGAISQICNHAAEQINGYKDYIEQHGHFLRDHGWPKLHGVCEGIIVIGRRNDPGRSKYADKLRAFKRQQISVASYDRLFEECQFMQAVFCRWEEDLARLTKDVSNRTT
jgi:antiviral defense system Shedu protein SduA